MEGRHNAHAHWPFLIMDKQLLFPHTDGDKDATLHQYTEVLHRQKHMSEGHMLHHVPQIRINVTKSSDDSLADMYAGEQTESWERPTPNAHWESREAAGETDGDIRRNSAGTAKTRRSVHRFHITP